MERFATLLRGLLVGGLLLATGVAAGQTSQPDGGLEAYYSANGLLNRGLYELAAQEYRTFLAAQPEHEKAPVARYGLAVCCFRLERFDEAATELEPLTRQDDFPYAAEVWTMLAQCRLAQKQYAPAAEACARVVKKYAKHELADDAGALRAEALYLAGETAETVRWCGDFAKRWPESPLLERVDYYWGLALMAQGDHAGAAQRLEELVTRFPAGTFAEHAALLVGQCYQRTNALEPAARWYQRVLERENGAYVADARLGLATVQHALGRNAEAGTLLDQLLEASPEAALTARARLERGRVWFDQQQYERALALFEQVGGTDGELADDAAYWAGKCELRMNRYAEAARRLGRASEQYADSELLPEMCYDRIVALVQLEDYAAASAAIDAFRTRFAKHALAADALYLAAVIEHRRHRYDESLQHCEQFLKDYAKHASASAVAFLAAENQYLAGRYAEALAAYERFEQAYPRDAQLRRASYRAGMALYRLGRADDAAARLGAIPDADLRSDEYRPALLALGDIEFQRGEWKAAEQRLTAYLATTDPPATDEALLKLGLALQRQQRYEEALRAYERLLAAYPQSAQRWQATFERGQALLALERFDDAQAVFERVVSEGADARLVPHAHNHLGALAMRRGAYADAAEHFARVLDAPPDEATAAEALYQRGQALLLLEQYPAAQEVLAQFLKRHATHERALRARAQLAIAQSRQERYAEALKLIGDVERDGLSTLDSPLQAAVRYEQAWCLRRLGKSDKAADVYRKLVTDATGPLNLHAALELAEIEAAAKEYKPAAELLRRVRTEATDATDPAVVEKATYRLGVCEFELGNLEEAAKIMEGFVEKFPTSELMASASFFCGEAYSRSGRHERAVRHFQRVADDFVGDPVHAPSLLRLGESLGRLQYWARSEKAYTDYLERYPDAEQWFQAQFGIGWARESQGRQDEAIAAYRAVVERHKGPTAARAQFQIGECLFAKKQYEEAARELLKVDILYAYPEWSAAALYEAGRCFESLGKTVEARRQFKTVTEKHKETHWAELAQQRLAALPDGMRPGGG